MATPIKTILFIWTCWLITLPAQAGLHFEAMANYALGEGREKNTGADSSHSGYLYGLRLGLYKPKFQLGLEYNTGELRDEDDQSSLEIRQTPHYMGAYLGLNLKKRVGLNLSYFPKVRFNGDDRGKLSGMAWKVGMYYRLKTHISLRLSYQHTIMDHDEVSDTALNNKRDYKTILIGLSFPFVL